LRFTVFAAQRPESAQPAALGKFKFGVCEHTFKFRHQQHGHGGIFQSRHRVKPALCHAIACVIVGNICAADEDDFPVTNQQFTMIAYAEATEAERIEKFYHPAGGGQRCKKSSRQHERAEGIDQNTDLDISFCSCGERLQKLPARLVIGEDIHLQYDVALCLPDGCEHGREKFPAAAIPVRLI